MAEFLGELSLFPLVLTMGAFQIGLWCQKKWRSPVFNPILIAVAFEEHYIFHRQSLTRF